MAAHFTTETMRFLRALGKNNDRAWFEDRRDVYEAHLKAPLHAVVDEINISMADFAPLFIRPAHKIAMRIFRDTRFSPDKRPYKTNLAAWWAQRGLERDSGAGFYLQVSPEHSFLAAGVYGPEREAMLRLRRWIAENHESYRDVLGPLLKSKGKLPAMAPLEGNALTRAPKGFPPDHPADDLLRARNWGVTAVLPAEIATSPELAKAVVAQFRRAVPLVDLLNQPLGQALAGGSSKAMF